MREGRLIEKMQLIVTEKPTRLAPGAMWARARALWKRVASLGQSAPRRLRVSETVALGERRFVAIVEFERSRFLLGGTSSSLVLLANLGNESGLRSGKELRVEAEGPQVESLQVESRKVEGRCD